MVLLQLVDWKESFVMFSMVCVVVVSNGVVVKYIKEMHLPYFVWYYQWVLTEILIHRGCATFLCKEEWFEVTSGKLLPKKVGPHLCANDNKSWYPTRLKNLRVVSVQSILTINMQGR